MARISDLFVKYRRHKRTNAFPSEDIVYAPSSQLSWPNLRSLIYIDAPFKREFYLEMCRNEGWGNRTLQDHRRIELDWGPNGGRDAACAGRPQHVVRPDGTRWDVTLCQYEVLSAVLLRDPVPMGNDAEQRQAEWGGQGLQSIRLQGPDGFGLLARQRNEPPERG